MQNNFQLILYRRTLFFVIAERVQHEYDGMCKLIALILRIGYPVLKLP